MSQKRPRDDDEQARSDGHNPSVRKQKKARRSVTIEDNEELLSSIPKLVKEEVKKAKKQVKKELKKKFGWLLRKYCASKKRRRGRQMRKSASRTLQLKFRNNLSLPIFTLTEIEGEDPSVLTIALVDASTGQDVNSGPESSMKVEIVILEGNFKGDEDNNWTFEHFSNNIVREGKDNRTLLTGDVFLTLNEGIGVAGKLKITDNSSRTKKRKFRLAARVPDGYFDGTRVKEAITEPFAVEERRGKSYMKKHPPSLDDEVWRLEKIGKELSKRLSSENVNTVKDFLLMLHADTPRLRKILGPGMNDKSWEIIKNHAEECDPVSEMWVYYSKYEQGKGVVFNIVGTGIGFHLKGQFIPINSLPEIQKVEMQKMIKVAYENLVEVVPYVDGAILGSSSNMAVDSFPCCSTRPENPTNTCSSSQHSGGPSLHQGQFIPINNLSEIQKVEMQKMIKVACENLGEVVPYVDRAILGSSSNMAVDSFPCGSTRPENPTNTCSSSQHSGGPFLHQGEFIPINLSEIQKVDMEQMVKECWGEVVPYVNGDIPGSSLNVSTYSFHRGSPRLELPDFGSTEWGNDASSLINEKSWWQNDAYAALSPSTLWPWQEPQADHVNATSSFSNAPVQSVAVKDKALRTWKTVITVLKVSKWIVALKYPDA
ncbi:calmodulin-binding protein 60 D-like [Magnolia sinica]|uniref:calmodulin-binding protein 60 D-like n=1 Tax=Magnolia sinica TaxID=86752 RepID=UPI0026581587|nr:calmodulin-binding protein 60 D-like [Magnolia sinica]